MTEISSKDGSTFDSADGKMEVEQIENEPTYVKPTFGQKVKRHCARFWWLHVIIFIICFLIVTLCLVYVAMPRIAQAGVNRSSLNITELDFLDPAPNNMRVTQRATLHSTSRYTPTLDPFNASTTLVAPNGTVYETPFIYLPFPKIHALHGNTNVSVDNQVIPLTDIDGIAAFATAALVQEYVSVVLKGRPKLHLGGLPVIHVNYNEQVKYKGLNGLAGFNVTDARIDLKALPNEPNLKANAFIPNHSIITMELGNVTLSLSSIKSGFIGNATINNMTLKPGNNSLPLTGLLNQTAVINSMDNGIVDLLITGQESVYNGNHLPYYEKALQSNVLKLQMNVLQILSDSSSS